MLTILSSPSGVAPNGTLDNNVVNFLKEISVHSKRVAIVSNHSEPIWFQSAFRDTNVKFFKLTRRQDGTAITRYTENNSIKPYDVLILASNKEDVMMGKNGKAVLISLRWSSDNDVKNLGIGVNEKWTPPIGQPFIILK